MNKFTTKFALLSPLLLLALVCFGPSKVHAVTAADWKAGRIIDDSVFTNSTSMTPQEVQNFLNARVPVCDTNGTQATGRWNASAGRYYTRAEWGALNGNPAPFTCLKDFWEVPKTDPTPGQPANNYGGAPVPAGAKSAAQIIWDAAQRYQISPKVLLTTIQKESYGPLTSDDWPYRSQYQYPMGAHCPDTAPCDPAYEGFSIQIYESARLFRYYINNMNQSWWPYKKPNQNNSILYNPNAACGSSNVYIESYATAALYTYTPYQPNAAALANMNGTGDSCSAYGNRNFWRIFSDWFGSTTGPDYSWSIESYTYSGGDNRIGVGETETVTLKAKNTGRQPWYNHGNNPLRLGTWEPADRVSSLFSSNRLATLQENSVLPGETGTFIFTVTPQRLGTYSESLNLVLENFGWASWPGFRPTINVVPAYDSQVQSVTYSKGTGLMDPGENQLITIIVKNTGTATWNKLGANPVRIGTWLPDRKSTLSQTWPSQTRAADTNELSVAPGQNAGFQFYVTMPSGGQKYENFAMVAENAAWLNNSNFTLYLQGKTYTWQPLWHSHSTGSANIPRNTDFTLTVKVKNTGQMAWTKTAPFPIRLATVSPLDRGSSIYSPSWIRDTRPATLLEDTVLPGQEGTFVFAARTPGSLGPRLERFSLVAEGISWFNDPGFSIYVNVTE